MTTDPEPRWAAARLGFDEPTIQRLEACGYLDRLELTEAEARARLFRAHLAHLRSQLDPLARIQLPAPD